MGRSAPEAEPFSGFAQAGELANLLKISSDFWVGAVDVPVDRQTDRLTNAEQYCWEETLYNIR